MGSFRKRACKIKLAAFDVDGVMTDGFIVMSGSGELCKHFSVKDGYGLKALEACGITVAVITGRKSDIVNRRLGELGVKHVFQGSSDKRETFLAMTASLGIKPEECAYMGDDIPDLPILLLAGIAIAPADAVPEVIRAADFVTAAAGGRGAAREACEKLLRARGDWDALIERRCAPGTKEEAK